MSKHISWLAGPAERGHFTLPPELTAAARTLDRLTAHTINTPARTPNRVVAEFQAELLRAAGAGDPLPGTLPGLAAAEAEQGAHVAAGNALRAATERARDALTGTVLVMAETTIAEHLRPAHAATVAAAAQVAPLLRQVGADPDAIARADARTRKAVAEFGPLVERYAAIRGVWSRLIEAGHVPLVYPGHVAAYTEFRRPERVWPEYAAARHQARAGLTPPWQSLDTRERLLRVAEHAEAGEVWMPTAADLNEAIRSDNAEGIEQQESAAWTREMVAGAFGPSGR